MKRAAKRQPRRAHKPVKYKLPVTKRAVTTTTRTQFGNADTGALLDQAFVAADDGDCSRVVKILDRAEAAGASVSLHRKQLLQDCKLDRTGLAALPPVGRYVGGQRDWFNWRTGLVLVGGLWLGSKFFK